MVDTKQVAQTLSDDNAVEQLAGGETGCDIYRIKYRENQTIIKIASGTKQSLDEINNNLFTYSLLDKQGIGKSLNPEILESVQQSELAYIIMEDLGSSVYSQITQCTLSCKDASETMIEKMDYVYGVTLLKNNTIAIQWLDEIKKSLVKYLQRLENENITVYDKISEISGLDMSVLAPAYVTFANGDFTPDNAFITNNQLKLIDHKGLLGDTHLYGINCVDLVMWDTHSNEIHGFKNAQEVSEKIVRPYIQEQLEIVEAPKPKALYSLGKARQFSLSSYYGHKKNRANNNETIIRLQTTLDNLIEEYYEKN